MRRLSHALALGATLFPVPVAFGCSLHCDDTINVSDGGGVAVMSGSSGTGGQGGGGGAAGFGGTTPGTCDDNNPCTDDEQCTPCSALPLNMQNSNECTADQNIDPRCFGAGGSAPVPVIGCAHFPVTTPPGQVNACFPVVPWMNTGAPKSGVCAGGFCINNP